LRRISRHALRDSHAGQEPKNRDLFHEFFSSDKGDVISFYAGAARLLNVKHAPSRAPMYRNFPQEGIGN
jgi:hypothetical protein